MLNEDLLARAQVAHLYLKAADQGIIPRIEAEAVLSTLFQELFPNKAKSPRELVEHPLLVAARNVLYTTEQDAKRPTYSLNVREALVGLQQAIQSADIPG